MNAQRANDYANLCERFDKKLHDLELTRVISLQMAPQIRMVQNNDTLISEKIQTSLVNTIPLWKSQMVLALGIRHSQEAIQAQRAVSDMTNELLKKNADMLKTATVETARNPSGPLWTLRPSSIPTSSSSPRSMRSCRFRTRAARSGSRQKWSCAKLKAN